MRIPVPATRRCILIVTAALYLITSVGVFIAFHANTLLQRKVEIKQLFQAYGIGKLAFSEDRQTSLRPNSSNSVKRTVLQGIAKDTVTSETLHSCEQALNNAGNTTVNTVPVEDFIRYPCILGTPLFPADKWPTEGRCVRTFCYSEEKNKATKNCVPLQTFPGTTPICTYPVEKDIWVSGYIHKTGNWEGDLVQRLADVFVDRPDLEFLDLGCNIGAYTLALAHHGVKVTAVDPMLENLELLSQSLKLGKLQQNVTLIWNAISDKRQLITLKFATNNVGGTQIQDANSKNAHGYMARTILLDDLLPLLKGKHIIIKMDIETTEYFALVGGNRFFEEVDVFVIQLEFAAHKTGPHGNKILELLSSKGYSPFGNISVHYPLTPIAINTWPNDIYFIKF